MRVVVAAEATVGTKSDSREHVRCSSLGCWKKCQKSLYVVVYGVASFISLTVDTYFGAVFVEWLRQTRATHKETFVVIWVLAKSVGQANSADTAAGV